MLVNRILRSVYFWLVIAGLGLLLLLSKGGASKLAKIVKILATLFVRLLDLFFALFNLKIERVKNFVEASEM